MSDQSPPVPPSLLKLEHLRIRSELHFAARRALNERRKEISDQRTHIRQEMAKHGQRRETLAKLDRWMAALDAVDAVVATAYDELSASSGDVGAYRAAAEHLQQTVADWGLSQ